MGKKLKVLFIGAILALLCVSVVPTAIMAAPQSMSAAGTVDYISGTVGFPSGNSSNYMVQSRTVSGSFTSGDLSGDYSMTYKGNINLNTQSGNIIGTLTTGSYRFIVDGTSYPVSWSPSPDSPVGFIGTSSVGGIWKWKDGGGQGNFSAKFSFVPTPDGHIDYILPGSTFSMSGQWNLKD